VFGYTYLPKKKKVAYSHCAVVVTLKISSDSAERPHDA